jgi:DNA-binding NarL/FixJ family response regulator
VTRVLIASASAVVRAGLEAIIKASPALEVVGSSPGTDSLARYIETTQPDVVLVELERGDDGLAPSPLGFDAVSGSPAVVALTDGPDGAALADALRLGARAVLPRDAAAEEIVAAVEAAAVGLMVLDLSSASVLLPLLAAGGHAAPSSQTETLTPREIEVLGMLAEGAGNKIIARRLGISEHTVKFHVGSILAKLNASSRTEAVTIGVRQGLIML